MPPRFFRSASEWARWLRANHARVPELWVGFYNRRSTRTGITYAQALDQALCYGWIDGVRRSVDATRYVIRFTPRRRGSRWSRANIARVGELTRLGQMAPSGRAAFAEWERKTAAQTNPPEEQAPLDTASRAEFKANAKAWSFFSAQPPYYRKTVTRWVMSAVKPETRRRRLAALIKDSEQGRRAGIMGRPAVK